MNGAVIKRAGYLYVPAELLKNYAQYNVIYNDYTLLQVKKPGLYLTQDSMYYRTAGKGFLFEVEPDLLSELTTRSDGVIFDELRGRPAVFRPADLPRLYTELFS